MNPYSGMTYELYPTGEAGDPPMWGATIPASDAVESGAINFEALDEEHKEDLEALIEKRGRLVAVNEEVVQKLRLGERELRRRKQRRR